MKMSRGVSMSGVLGSALAALTLCLAASAHAAPPQLKPGLWEMQMQGGNGAGMPDMAEMQKAMQRMQAQMAKMPPEQRKMMEAQMGNMGVAVSGTGLRICLTEDDIKREEIPVSDGKCTTKVVTRTASRWVADITCTEPPSQGQAEVIFESAKAYRMSMKGTMLRDGRQQPYSMSTRMQHVATDCGKIKPASELRAQHQQQMQQYQQQMQQQKKIAR